MTALYARQWHIESVPPIPWSEIAAMYGLAPTVDPPPVDHPHLGQTVTVALTGGRRPVTVTGLLIAVNAARLAVVDTADGRRWCSPALTIRPQDDNRPAQR